MTVRPMSHRIAGAGVTLSVDEAGDHARPAVVLVHGYPDTKAVWSAVMERLKSRYHVVAYDVRGAGGSTAPADAEGYDLACLVDDALAVFDTVSPNRPVHLVGHDWGSVQGWEFVTNPRSAHRIASFTSISGPSLDHLGMWIRRNFQHPRLDHFRTMAEQAVRSWYVGALLLPGLAEVAWPAVWGPTWPAFLQQLEAVPARDAYPDHDVAGEGVHGAWLYRRNVPARLLSPQTEAVAPMPVQLIIPQWDRFLSPAVYEGIEALAPRLRRRTIEAGHWVPRTHPDQLAQWIGAFVEEVEAARS